ncbi:uncharacterized protein LOC133837265 [Drosophila sulfurigaster albostrigata]|uniref:uncharacterized protein LOC133837265 n=1 Tax=Drosophila sulfurigaster albostrigata TaxID=89887 RepID=UPI002D21B26E|nr:uncharacterized protein LOC133837265 [Drosophila sulfurigaster albostrigata]
MYSKRLRNALFVEKKKLELKRRFKKVLRLIIINSQWLDSNKKESPYENIFNPKEDIRFLVRTTQKSDLFTATDKSLLRTPHSVRTADDRKRLYTVFANLKCFRDVPPILRFRLLPVINFMSVNSGRTIMQQGDVPHTVIFIVTGNIEMSTTKKSGGEIMFGPGDYIGDVELLEECDRIHTFRTKSQCELLAVDGDDFNCILSGYMKKVWLDKKRALKALDYFNFLNDDQILKTCKMSSLKQFKPLDTIYSHDKGTLTNVHFVLSGECVILQCLNMKVRKSKGKKIYELDDTVDETITEDSENEVKEKESKLPLGIEISEAELKKKKSLGKLNLEQIELACGIIKVNDKQRSILSHLGYTKKRSSGRSGLSDYPLEGFEDFEENSRNYSFKSLENRNNSEVSDMISTIETAIETDESEFCEIEESLHEFSSIVLADTIESHFIDVGSLTFGGIFGLGEKSQHRVIMARDVVQCLMIPRFFLMDQELNPGNVWQRRLFYLNCIIPTREMLFNDFLQNLKWKKFKTKYINENIKTQNEVAAIHDIPILCRIEEGIV